MLDFGLGLKLYIGCLVSILYWYGGCAHVHSSNHFWIVELGSNVRNVYAWCSCDFVFVGTFVCYFVANDACVGFEFVDGNFV